MTAYSHPRNPENPLRGPILVTGSTGLVGQGVVRHLVSSGAEVLSLARSESTQARMFKVDLARVDAEDLVRLISPEPKAIIHVAAAVPTRAEIPDSEKNAADTLVMTKTIIRAAERWKAHVVHISSCGLYDREDRRSKTETAAVVCRTPYLQAKRDGEIAVERIGGASLRISGPVGPGMSPTLVLPRFIDRVRRREPIQIWGSGTREQDFVSVTDIAEAAASTLRAEATGIFNIASGRPITMQALGAMVVRVMGTGSIETIAREDPLDGQTANYSIEKAASLLAWKPQRELEAELTHLRMKGEL